jgi:hypothetical protein
MKRRLWMSVAVIAVVAGITAAAVMAAQPASHPHAHHHHRKGQHKRRGGLLTTAASYLGTSPAQLRSELSSGKSLAEIANATSGKSSQGLIEALEAADKRRLASVAARLQTRIAARVDRPGGWPRRCRQAQSPTQRQTHDYPSSPYARRPCNRVKHAHRAANAAKD